MQKNTTKTENKAVRVVESRIESCPRLFSYIQTNDRTPSWDGEVHLHKDDTDSKDTLQGRVPVQVKGRNVAKVSQTPFAYNIKVSDLRNYLRDYGCIYFVVAMNAQGQTKIYYKSLTVVAIKNILKNLSDGQKTCSINLNSLPDDNNKILSIFENFLVDRQKQSSFAGKPILSMDEARLDPAFKSFTFSTITCGNSEPTITDLLEYSQENDLYIYANIEGSPIPVPTSDVVKLVGIGTQSSQTISIDGTIYYDSFSLFLKNEKTVIQFGGAFTLTFNSDFTEIRLTTNPPDDLDKHIRMVQFIIALTTQKHFSIGGKEIYLGEDAQFYNPDECQRDLGRFMQLKELLLVMHVTDKCDVVSFTTEHWRSFQILYKGIVQKQPIEHLRIDGQKVEHLLCGIVLGNLEVRCYVQSVDNVDDTYIIDDAFNMTGYALGLERTDGSFEISTMHVILSFDEFVRYANVNYEYIVPEIQEAYEHKAPILFSAFNTIDNLLIAYDSKRDARMLQTARDLMDWLLPMSIPNVSEVFKNLLRIQIVKRNGQISESDNEYLYKVVDGLIQCDGIERVSAYALLGDIVTGRRFYDRLSSPDKEFFDASSFYHYYTV